MMFIAQHEFAYELSHAMARDQSVRILTRTWHIPMRTEKWVHHGTWQPEKWLPKRIFVLGMALCGLGPSTARFLYLAVCQNLVPLVNIKIAGKWMFIPLKMVLVGIDPYPTYLYLCLLFFFCGRSCFDPDESMPDVGVLGEDGLDLLEQCLNYKAPQLGEGGYLDVLSGCKLDCSEF
jgi:hypothetical protein